MRRDENSILLIARALNDPTPTKELFISIQPLLLVLAQTLYRYGVEWYRIFAMLCALVVAAVTAVTARALWGQRRVAGVSAYALVLSSTLLVSEGTYFRGDLPSLMLSMIGLSLLAARGGQSRWLRSAIAGILLGLAIGVKVLALAMLPIYLVSRVILEDSVTEKPKEKMLSDRFLGMGLVLTSCAVVSGTLRLVLGSGSAVALGMNAQLGLAVGFGMIFRHFARNFATAFLDMWIAWTLLLVFHVPLYVVVLRRRLPNDLRRIVLFLDAWLLTVVAAFLINYPDWLHHYIYLVPPLAIGGGLCISMILNPGGRPCSDWHFAVFWIGLTLLGLKGPLVSYRELSTWTPTRDTQRICDEIRLRTTSSEAVWSDNHLFPLLADRATHPWLVEVSWKRIASGALTEDDLVRLFLDSPPSAVVFWDGLFAAFPGFSHCVRESFATEYSSDHLRAVSWVDDRHLPVFSGCIDLQ